MRARHLDEIGKRRNVENLKQVLLVPGVQDDAGEAIRRHRLDRGFLDAVFRQHDSKDVCPARQRGGGLDDVLDFDLHNTLTYSTPTSARASAADASLTPALTARRPATAASTARTRSSGGAPCTSIMSAPRATALSASAGPVTPASKSVMDRT